MAKHQVPPGQLNIHADGGKVMTSKPVAFLMAYLGVTRRTAALTFLTTTRNRKPVPQAEAYIAVMAARANHEAEVDQTPAEPDRATTPNFQIQSVGSGLPRVDASEG